MVSPLGRRRAPVPRRRATDMVSPLGRRRAPVPRRRATDMGLAAGPATSSSPSAQGYRHGLAAGPAASSSPSAIVPDVCPPAPPKLPRCFLTRHISSPLFSNLINPPHRFITTAADGNPAGDKEAYSQKKIGEPTLQKSSYGNFNPDDPDLVDPFNYFYEKKILHDVQNNLVRKSVRERSKEIPPHIIASFFSLLDVVVENYLDNVSVLQALDPKNLLVSKKTGKFCFRAVPKVRLKLHEEEAIFKKLHYIIVHYIKTVEGDDALDSLPHNFRDFLKKLEADNLNVKMLVFHPIFFTWASSLLLRILLDLIARRPLRLKYCHKRNRKKKMLRKMAYLTPAELSSIIDGNAILSSLREYSVQEKKKREKEREEAADTKRMGSEERAMKGAYETKNSAKGALPVDLRGNNTLELKKGTTAKKATDAAAHKRRRGSKERAMVEVDQKKKSTKAAFSGGDASGGRRKKASENEEAATFNKQTIHGSPRDASASKQVTNPKRGRKEPVLERKQQLQGRKRQVNTMQLHHSSS